MTKYKNEMKFHILMFMNAWMMLMLMKCKCKLRCLTQRCYKNPSREEESQPLEISVEIKDDLFMLILGQA